MSINNKITEVLPCHWEMIILWWLFIPSQFPFDYISHYNDGANRKWYQGIGSIEAFEYENTRSDVKCCDY